MHEHVYASHTRNKSDGLRSYVCSSWEGRDPRPFKLPISMNAQLPWQSNVLPRSNLPIESAPAPASRHPSIVTEQHDELQTTTVHASRLWGRIRLSDRNLPAAKPKTSWRVGGWAQISQSRTRHFVQDFLRHPRQVPSVSRHSPSQFWIRIPSPLHPSGPPLTYLFLAPPLISAPPHLGGMTTLWRMAV